MEKYNQNKRTMCDTFPIEEIFDTFFKRLLEYMNCFASVDDLLAIDDVFLVTDRFTEALKCFRLDKLKLLLVCGSFLTIIIV